MDFAQVLRVGVRADSDKPIVRRAETVYIRPPRGRRACPGREMGA